MSVRLAVGLQRMLWSLGSLGSTAKPRKSRPGSVSRQLGGAIKVWRQELPEVDAVCVGVGYEGEAVVNVPCGEKTANGEVYLTLCVRVQKVCVQDFA